jgi:hypothetical protein
MRVLVRILVASSLVALAAPGVASAALRMPVGFQDDPTFRWNGRIAEELDAVQAAHASIIRTTANWSTIATRRPAKAANPFDPAYRLDDLDDLIRNAQRRGIEVMITIWGTPRWANGGKAPNVPPLRPADLTNFARALADRYSGRHPGYPYIGRYSVWNEPNLGIFLSQQFDSKGQIISPRVYAGLYRAGYRGIKTANKTALVAIGETSNQGRDRPLPGAPVSVAPATFARLLAQEKGLQFDAYATHPYATRPSLPPTQKVRWPNVTLTQLKRFERSLDTWFNRKNIPVWVTEYGYETKPAEPNGVTPAQQASYLSTVLRQLRADPRVQMFIWFVFRDSKGSLWQSGLFNQAGVAKPAYRTFSTLAETVAGDTKTIAPGVAPTITLPVPQLAFASPLGSMIGVTYRVYLGATLVAVGQPAGPLLLSQSVSFVANFQPAVGRTYRLEMEANDVSGNRQLTTYNLVASAAAAS